MQLSERKISDAVTILRAIRLKQTEASFINNHRCWIIFFRLLLSCLLSCSLETHPICLEQENSLLKPECQVIISCFLGNRFHSPRRLNTFFGLSRKFPAVKLGNYLLYEEQSATKWQSSSPLEPWAGLNTWLQGFGICRLSYTKKINFLTLNTLSVLWV